MSEQAEFSGGVLGWWTYLNMAHEARNASRDRPIQALVAVVFSALAVEAWVNETGASAAGESASSWGDEWSRLEEGRRYGSSTLTKTKAAIRCFDPSLAPTDLPWFVAVEALFGVRNNLAHYRLDHHRFCTRTGERLSEPSDRMDPLPEPLKLGKQDLLGAVASPEVANWAFDVARHAIEAWIELSPHRFSARTKASEWFEPFRRSEA